LYASSSTECLLNERSSFGQRTVHSVARHS
jgi:hypothetical protein